MTASSMIPKDHPCKIAWNSYKETDEYKNTRKWALHDEHVDGSLWAAFENGFRAALNKRDANVQPKP